MTSHTSDGDIIPLSQLKEGSEMAFDEIYDRYAGILALKLKALVKIPEVVEELHQDIFIRLWNNRHQIQEQTNLKAYLFTIAHHLSIDFYRKVARDKAL